MWKIMIWTNANVVYWRIYAALGEDELMKPFSTIDFS